jgi:predicted acetyltransferase
VREYTVRFDGHSAGMGGAAGVATLPEARQGGYVRKTFEKILPAMLEEGKVFSFLYPFNYDFYRKFGYELCYSANRVTVPMYFFKEYRYTGGFEQYFPGGDVSELLGVYTAFIKDKNLAIVRGEAAMREITDKDPYTDRHYAYLHRGGDGKADAYLLFNVQGDPDEGRVLNVREMAWTSPETLHALYGFIGGLAPEFGNLQWDAPRFCDVASLFGDPMDITVSHPPGGMNRVVDVHRALELAAAPVKPGKTVIGVTDSSLPHNSGTYEIEWADGKVVQVKRTAGQADMETDVQTLAQLVTGYLTPDQAALKRGTVIRRNRETLRSLFPHKDLMITERF